MKKTTSVIMATLAGGVLATALPVTAPAQVSVDATAGSSARVVEPIGLLKQNDLRFGALFSPALPGGTVTVSEIGIVTSSGVILATSGTLSRDTGAAGFFAFGETGESITIDVPVSTTIECSGTAPGDTPPSSCAGESMLVDLFTSFPPGGDVLVDVPACPAGAGPGCFGIDIGATLHVGANQGAGFYEGSFEVSVQYN